VAAFDPDEMLVAPAVSAPASTPPLSALAIGRRF
jgi:hypothetical protein